MPPSCLRSAAHLAHAVQSCCGVSCMHCLACCSVLRVSLMEHSSGARITSKPDGGHALQRGGMQVAEALTPEHCLRALQSLADEAGAAALPPEQRAAALRLADRVHELQAQGHSFHGQACHYLSRFSSVLTCPCALPDMQSLPSSWNSLLALITGFF